jgi:predicted ATPase/class 3 adenylate cyclase
MASRGIVTFLFTDIEGSTRLWEREPERMRPALAQHDAIARGLVERHRGVLVKMSGDGVHAAFDDPLDAVTMAIELQRSLADPEATHGVSLLVRCGLHAGVEEHRDNDFFGRSVNRAARIMSAAHGGQVLVSETVATLLRERLPDGVGLRDLGSARLRDLASPERIFQIEHVELRRDFPALRSLEGTPNNLPQQMTSFVGRESELAEVTALLAGSRLVTLVGPGGIGKTRLSLQVAADAMDDFPDGVWLIELAPLTDPARVPQAVASVLGVKEEAGRPVLEAVLKHVAQSQLLLVLDNCEHLPNACAELASALLQASPRLKIIASSREHLHTAGERVHAVHALSLPQPQQIASIEALSGFEAVRLFVERASAAQPAFRATDANAAAIADICRRLDGIPLAIELAAARVRALSVEAIATRLGDRFRLLAGGNRAALPRQQTLRALIDWSYDLLTEPERTVLRRLSVFAGGWTLEAAEGVTAGGAVRDHDVLEQLTHLVEKSLVVLEPAGNRYHLLDTVRQYAQDRLDEAGDGDDARNRHLAFHLALAQKARPELVGSQQQHWLARLDLEQENLLLAHAWSGRAQGAAESGLRLVSSMRRYWMMRGLLGLARRATVDALSRPGAQTRNLARADALFDAGQLDSWTGHYSEARSYLEESLAIAREIGDKAMVAHVLQTLGLAAFGQGNIAEARQHFVEALALQEQLGDKREVAAALNALAQLHRVEGASDTAEPLYRRVLSLARELKDREGIAIALLNLAMVAIARRLGEAAREMLLEVASIVKEIGSKPLGQSMLEVSAGLAVLRKEWKQAARWYGAAEAEAQRTGLQRDPADEAFLAPLIAEARQTLGESAFAAEQAGGGALAWEAAALEASGWLERRA